MSKTQEKIIKSGVEMGRDPVKLPSNLPVSTTNCHPDSSKNTLLMNFFSLFRDLSCYINSQNTPNQENMKVVRINVRWLFFEVSSVI